MWDPPKPPNSTASVLCCYRHLVDRQLVGVSAGHHKVLTRLYFSAPLGEKWPLSVFSEQPNTYKNPVFIISKSLSCPPCCCLRTQENQVWSRRVWIYSEKHCDTNHNSWSHSWSPPGLEASSILRLICQNKQIIRRIKIKFPYKIQYKKQYITQPSLCPKFNNNLN